MEAEYQVALKTKMNVMIANGVSEANKYLAGRNKKYQRIISSGHGGAKGTQVLVAGAAYSIDDVKRFEKDFKVFSGYLKEDGMIISLACYNTTPDVIYKTYDANEPENTKEVSINRRATAFAIAFTTGKTFFGSDSEVLSGQSVFNGGDLKARNIKPDNEYHLHKATHNQWTMIGSDAQVNTYKDVIMKSDGSMYGVLTTNAIRKLVNAALGYINEKLSKTKTDDKKKSKYFFTSFCLILAMGCGNNISESPQTSGFYRSFSFKKNIGEDILDTTKSKKDNKLLNSYCYVNSVNDSFKIINFYSNLKDGAYNDLIDASTVWAYTSGEKTIYESELNSNANGPGKEFRLVFDSIDKKFTLYYFLPPPPISDSTNDRSVWLDYYIRGNAEKKDSSVRLLIRPIDTVNFKKTLFEPERLELILSKSEVKN